jgi:hypothetical protein
MQMRQAHAHHGPSKAAATGENSEVKGEIEEEFPAREARQNEEELPTAHCE